ncbi:MAG: adenosylcobinamide-GDP ribazoletransferase [Bacillota bacterium]|nr:adenosylcobinamide-GDP ribazoletransferase [Bacillota bacterium]
MFRSFLLMLSFFSRIPVGRFVEYTEERYRRGVPLFPFVGLATGVPIALFVYAIGKIGIATPLHGLLITIVYLGFSGGIHLDGLADTADGFQSGRDRERILEIMKDPRIGSFGVIALILWMAIMVVASPLVKDPLIWLMFPAVGKSIAMFLAARSPYARPEGGMGKIFMERANAPIAFLFLFALGAAMYFRASWTGVAAVIAAFAAGYLSHKRALRRIGGHTGDTIGSMIEVTQLIFLLVTASGL